MNWYDAVKWLNARSEMEGLTPVNRDGAGAVYRRGEFIPDWHADADGFRLPTEAEWEFAARGGVLSEGFLYSGSNDFTEVTEHRRFAQETLPVGRFKANELGIHDMTGNVVEWCWDWSLDNGVLGPAKRGGSSHGIWDWGDPAGYLQLARRYNTDYNQPQQRTVDIGFRAARSHFGGH